MTTRAKRPLATRFWEKVQKTDSCWLWTGATIRGYGVIWENERKRAARAHRVAWELLRGPIPDGLTLDHLCRTTLCVNPDHLEPCGAGENARRSPLAPYNVKARATHCKRGHVFDGANTSRHHGRRECRACTRDRARQRAATCPKAVEFRSL